MTIRPRVIPLAELTPAEEAAWRDLAGRAVDPNPFVGPDFLLSAHAHLPEAARMRLWVAEEGDRFLGSIPVGLPERWRALPRRAVLTRSSPTATLLSNPLLDPAAGAEAASALLGGIGQDRLRAGYGLLVAEWLTEGTSARQLREGAAALGFAAADFHSFERPMLWRREGPGEYWAAAVGAKHRKRLAYSRRRMEREVGPVEVVDRSADPVAPGDFLRLEISGWKRGAPDGGAFACQPETDAFFRDVCRRLAASGGLVLLSLEAGGQPIAMSCLVRGGEGLFAFRIGHDDRYKRYSPGTQLFVAALEHFDARTDAAWFDSCATPDNTYLPLLFPDRHRVSTVVVGLGGPVNGALARSLPLVRQAKAAVLNRPGEHR